MPAPAARLGDTILTGHLCSPIATIATPPQTKVIVDGSLGAVISTDIAPHTILAGKVCVNHPAIVTGGSTKVFYQGIPASRIGDGADMGCIISGSSKVFIG